MNYDSQFEFDSKGHGHIVSKNSSGHSFINCKGAESAPRMFASMKMRDTGTRVTFKKSESNPAIFWCRTDARSSAFAEWNATGLEC